MLSRAFHCGKTFAFTHLRNVVNLVLLQIGPSYISYCFHLCVFPMFYCYTGTASTQTGSTSSSSLRHALAKAVLPSKMSTPRKGKDFSSPSHSVGMGTQQSSNNNKLGRSRSVESSHSREAKGQSFSSTESGYGSAVRQQSSGSSRKRSSSVSAVSGRNSPPLLSRPKQASSTIRKQTVSRDPSFVLDDISTMSKSQSMGLSDRNISQRSSVYRVPSSTLSITDHLPSQDVSFARQRRRQAKEELQTRPRSPSLSIASTNTVGSQLRRSTSLSSINVSDSLKWDAQTVPRKTKEVFSDDIKDYLHSDSTWGNTKVPEYLKMNTKDDKHRAYPTADGKLSSMPSTSRSSSHHVIDVAVARTVSPTGTFKKFLTSLRICEYIDFVGCTCMCL